MLVINRSRGVAISMMVLFQASGVVAAQAAAPNSCSFITPAGWSAVVSRPVTGGTMSVVDNPASSASSCMYQAGAMLITLQVDQRATPAAAQKEYAEQLDNSRNRDQQQSQHTTVESGIGDSAFSSAFTDGSEVEFTAVQGSRIVTFGLIGAGAAAVPHDRLRGLMKSALSR
jgi:hypothetical protein